MRILVPTVKRLMSRVMGFIAGVSLIACLLGALAFNSAADFPATAAPLGASAAIVLLAGNYEERSPVAASLFLAGYAPRILLTDDGVRRGWSPQHQRNLYAIERTEIELVKRGVPQKAIVRLPFAKSGTRYDALAVREYLAREKLGSLILVTSDYHAPRALWVFQRVLRGLPVTVSMVPAPSPAASSLATHALERLKLIANFLHFLSA